MTELIPHCTYQISLLFLCVKLTQFYYSISCRATVYVVIWLRSAPTDCVGLAFIAFCYKQILYEIILYECYGHGKNLPRLF